MLCKQILNGLRCAYRCERGSYTLEAALLFPVIILILISLLFLSLFTYQKAEMFTEASTAALQTAYEWGDQDGLYAQVEQALHLWFQAPASSSSASVIREGKELTFSSHLPERMERKLLRSAELMSHVHRTQISYNLGWTGGKIEFAAMQPAAFPAVSPNWFAEELRVEAASWTADPVEWIRGTQLVRSFVEQLNLRGRTTAEAEQAIRAYLELSPQHHFRYHRQAAPYLKKLVNGKEVEMVLASGQKRLIDALDAGGVAHQAYVTFTVHNLRDQMAKDAELLERGRVKGVVWHFFKREGTTGRTGPPEAFVEELRSQGIVVVLHE